MPKKDKNREYCIPWCKFQIGRQIFSGYCGVCTIKAEPQSEKVCGVYGDHIINHQVKCDYLPMLQLSFFAFGFLFFRCHFLIIRTELPPPSPFLPFFHNFDHLPDSFLSGASATPRISWGSPEPAPAVVCRKAYVTGAASLPGYPVL